MNAQDPAGDLVLIPNFWRNKKVFLSGHTGFKGSWLSIWLDCLGARVHGYSLPPPTVPSLYQVSTLDDVVHSTAGDIRDLSALSDNILQLAPDVIIHLAAKTVVLTSYDQPIETYSTNVLGTACLLDAARRLTNRCAVIIVTTDKVYHHDDRARNYREDDRLGGRDPYSCSKACADLVARSYSESYLSTPESSEQLIGVASARAGNVIGGGDWTQHQLIPETIAALIHDKPLVLRNPNAIRPWQHVLDCLSGYLTLAEALYTDARRYSGPWNFGPADSDVRDVSQVVEVLYRYWGVKPRWVSDSSSYPREEQELRINSEKAVRELRWRRKLPIDAALAWTTDWFRRYKNAEPARALCVEQIQRYMSI